MVHTNPREATLKMIKLFVKAKKKRVQTLSIKTQKQCFDSLHL